MDAHAGRTEWTDPAEVTELLLALAAGGLDAWSGRMVRAGIDTVARESLRARAAAGDCARATAPSRWCPGAPTTPSAERAVSAPGESRRLHRFA